MASMEPLDRFGFVDRRALEEGARAILTRLGHSLDPRAKVKSLTVADQQMVEIAKALVGEAKLLVLDEPTAVISGSEAELLFDTVRRLRDHGVCIVYIGSTPVAGGALRSLDNHILVLPNVRSRLFFSATDFIYTTLTRPEDANSDAVTRKCRPDWDITTPELRTAW
ncbi:ATP-binding cassette domain-containing protein [Bradyrhizobium sp. UFLA05-109]